MKLRSLGICILLAAILLCMAFPVQAALAESTPVLLLSGKTEGNEIIVTATIRNNDGISAMLLNLEYDRELLTLTGYEQGEALSTLDVIASGSYDTYPYRITWSGDANDATNGKLLTLRFKAKENASGQAYVKFTYDRNKDVNYYEGGELMTRNLMTDTLRIDLASGEATAIASELPDPETAKEQKKSNTALVVGLAVGGTFAIVLIVGIPWFVVRKKKA